MAADIVGFLATQQRYSSFCWKQLNLLLRYYVFQTRSFDGPFKQGIHLPLDLGHCITKRLSNANSEDRVWTDPSLNLTPAELGFSAFAEIFPTLLCSCAKVHLCFSLAREPSVVCNTNGHDRCSTKLLTLCYVWTQWKCHRAGVHQPGHSAIREHADRGQLLPFWESRLTWHQAHCGCML